MRQLILIVVICAAFVSSALGQNAPAGPRFTIKDLGTLGGTESTGFAINNSGHVAGAYTTSDGSRRAFFWDGVAMKDIGDLGSGSAVATSINNADHVSGFSHLYQF